ALCERIHTNTHLFFQINHMITSPVQLIQIELMHAKHNQWKHYHFCCVEPALVKALSMERAGEKQRETVCSVWPTLLFEYLLNIFDIFALFCVCVCVCVCVSACVCICVCVCVC